MHQDHIVPGGVFPWRVASLPRSRRITAHAPDMFGIFSTLPLPLSTRDPVSWCWYSQSWPRYNTPPVSTDSPSLHTSSTRLYLRTRVHSCASVLVSANYFIYLYLYLYLSSLHLHLHLCLCLHGVLRCVGIIILLCLMSALASNLPLMCSECGAKISAEEFRRENPEIS